MALQKYEFQVSGLEFQLEYSRNKPQNTSFYVRTAISGSEFQLKNIFSGIQDAHFVYAWSGPLPQ